MSSAEADERNSQRFAPSRHPSSMLAPGLTWRRVADAGRSRSATRSARSAAGASVPIFCPATFRDTTSDAPLRRRPRDDAPASTPGSCAERVFWAGSTTAMVMPVSDHAGGKIAEAALYQNPNHGAVIRAGSARPRVLLRSPGRGCATCPSGFSAFFTPRASLSSCRLSALDAHCERSVPAARMVLSRAPRFADMGYLDVEHSAPRR